MKYWKKFKKWIIKTVKPNIESWITKFITQIKMKSKQQGALSRKIAKQVETRAKREDLDFTADCKAAELSRKSPLANMIIYLTLFFIFAFILWSYFANVDQVTVADGKIIPSSRIQHVQTLDGGVLEKILVTKDEVVKKNQILAQLDLTRYAAEYRASLARSQVLQASIARLKAQAEEENNINFPENIIKERPDLIARERKLFRQKRSLHSSHLRTLQRNYRYVDSEIKMISPLVAEGLISKVELMRLQREANELKGQIEDEQNEYRDDALTQLNEFKAELESITQSTTALKDRTEKTTIRSPVNGIVNKINIHTVGGVVKPGDTLMEIVPIHDKLLIEAKLTPAEVAFIHPDQPVTIKVTAYDFSIYGGLHGTVQSISADTTLDEKGNAFYLVLIKTPERFLEYKDKKLPLIPGMTVTAHIMTGKRSILHYLLKPLMRAKSNALSER